MQLLSFKHTKETSKNIADTTVKEKTLKFSFKILLIPGKWHHEADTCSRNSTQPGPHYPLENMTCPVITDHPTESDIHRSEEILNHVETNIINRIYT